MFDAPSTNQSTANQSASLIATSALPLSQFPNPGGSAGAVMFIDRRVADFESLIAGATAEVFILDEGRDGIAQISQVLAGRQNLAAIHIVSHGSAGDLLIGQTGVNQGNLASYEDALLGWRSALTEDADILLYGCDVASGELGQAFVSILSQLTGADVAASDDLTGNAAKGGNWTLEFHTGSIEAAQAFTSQSESAYQGVLSPAFSNLPSNVNFTENGSAITLASSLGANMSPSASAYTTNGASVQFASGFSAGDRLSIGGSGATSGSIGGTSINWSYNTSTGALTFSGVDTIANYTTALRQVTYVNTSDATSATARQLTYSINRQSRYYEYVSTPLTWAAARQAAETRSFLGMQGYLATITSAAENTTIRNTNSGGGGSWIGASDEAAEGQWRWVTGPEANTQFWQGTGFGSTVGGQFAAWNSGEPNDSNGEDYAEMGGAGSWNDLPSTSSLGYFVEYGGLSSDSPATGVLTINVTPVNDAPVLNATPNPVLTTINEDAGAPTGAVGTLVSSLVDLPGGGGLDNVTNPDTGAVTGIAITAADITNGTWWYSTTTIPNWIALGTPSAAASRLLAADANTRVYFQPTTNYNGTITNALTFRAWNATTGTNGGTADTSTNGGATAFSTATDSAAITVNAVNDAPVIAGDTSALNLDDANDFVALPNLGLSGNTSISVSAWVKVNDATAENIFGFGIPGQTSQVFSLRTGNSDGSFVLYFWGNDLIVTGLPSYVGQWTHVAATYDAGTQTQRIFVNGSEVGSRIASAPNFNNTGYRIGGFNNELFNGSLDQLGVWNTALSATNIQAIYNNGVEAVGGTIAYYSFAADSNASTVITDQSGNNFNGTLTNGQGNHIVTGVALTPVTTPLNPTFREAVGINSQGLAVNLFTSATVSTVEENQTIQSLTITASGLRDGANEVIGINGQSIALVSGSQTIDNITYNVTLSGQTATLRVTTPSNFSTDTIIGIINSLTYQNTNRDNPAPGNRTVSFSVQDNGSTANGGIDTSNQSPTSTITIVPLNDAPINQGLTSSIEIADNSAALPYPSPTTVTGITGPIEKVTVTLNGLNHTFARDLDILLVSPTGQSVLLLSDIGGGNDFVNATLTFDDAASQGFTELSTNLQSGTYSPSNADTTTDLFPGAAPAGPYSTSLASLNGLEANGVWRLFVRDDFENEVGKITGGWGLQITTANGTSQFNNIATISTQEDVPIAFTGSNLISLRDDSQDGNLNVNLTVTNGTLNLGSLANITGSGNGTTTLNYSGTLANLNAALATLTYTPTTNFTGIASISITTNDNGNTGGGPISVSDTGRINVIASSDAPSIALTPANPTFTEAIGTNNQTPAVAVFAAATTTSIEPGQLITRLTLTVAGLQDGANERLSVNGRSIPLGVASTVTTGNITYSTTIDNATQTATITLANPLGFTPATLDGILSGITYQNTNRDTPTPGSRIITLSAIEDNGGTATPGLYTTPLNLASTVTVVALNDAPTLSATAASPSFIEASGSGQQQAAVNPFADSAIGQLENGQSITSLILTISGLLDAANEVLSIDGQTITLNGPTNGTTATNGIGYGVTIDNGTATLTLTKAVGLNATIVNGLINGISYQNTNLDNPTPGDRIFTITQITDNGGNGGNNLDTTTLNLASIVSVVGSNDAPIIGITNDAPITISEGSTVTKTGTFSDIDSSVTLSASVGTITQDNVAGTWSWSYTPTDSGSSTPVTFTATDLQNATATTAFNLTVTNLAPTATFDNGGGVNEGSTGTVTFSAINDPSSIDQTSLRYAYDFNNDGTWDSGDGTYANSSNSSAIVVPASYFDDGAPGATRVVTGRIIDKDGGFTDYTTTIDILNVAPRLTGAQATIGSSTEDATNILLTTTQLLTGFTDVATDTLSIVTSPLPTSAQGTIAATAGGFTFTPTPDFNGLVTINYQVQDEDGGVIAASITFSLTPVNDAPVLTPSGNSATYVEDATAIPIDPNATLVDVDLLNFDTGILTVTITNGNADDRLTIRNGGSISVLGNTIFSGATPIGSFTGGTTSLTIALNGNSTNANVQELLQNIAYATVSQDPGTSSRSVEFVLTDGDGGTSNQMVKTIAITPRNDAPTLIGTALNPSFTADTPSPQVAPVSLFNNATVSTVEAGQLINSLTFTIAGIQDGADEQVVVNGQVFTLGAAAASIVVNDITYNLSLTTDAGTTTATLSLTNASGMTTAEANATINSITYQNTNTVAPTSGIRSITVSQLQDNGGSDNGSSDAQNPGLQSTVAVFPTNDPDRNDAPTLTAIASNPDFIEAAGTAQAAGVPIFTNAAARTIEAGQLIQSLTLTVDGLQDGANERLIIGGQSIALGATSSVTIAGLTYSTTVTDSTATIVLSSATGLTTTELNALITGIAYQNTNTETPSSGSRTITLTEIQDNGGTANGGSDTTTLAISTQVAVIAVNDAPTLIVTATNATFTEAAGLDTQTPATPVFTNAIASGIEPDHLIIGLIFTISGLRDGADEKITIGGQDIGFTNYDPNNILSTTVTITEPDGITTAELASFINSITYQNTNRDNPTAGERIFSISYVQDNGGILNGGSDTTNPNLQSVITVVAVNDAPSVTATSMNSLFVEEAGAGLQGAAVPIFASLNVSPVDVGQSITQLSLSLSGLADGDQDVITLDGQTIVLGSNSSGTTANGIGYSVIANTVNQTATIALETTAALSSELFTGLLNLTYQNTNLDNPTPGDRIVTITQVKDDGGTQNGGIDTATVSQSAIVTVHASNDAPSHSSGSGQPLNREISSPEDTVLRFTGSNRISISDIDAFNGELEISLSVTDGSLSFDNTSNLTGSGNGSDSLTYRGSLADLNTALQTLSYSPSSNFSGTTTLTLTTDDRGNTGGDARSVSDTITITVTPTNDAPTLTATGLNPSFSEQSGSTIADAVLIFDDAIANTNDDGQVITGLTLTVAGIQDGIQEVLVINGQTINLGTASTITIDDLTYSTTISGSTTTITLSSTVGFNPTTLLADISYQNTSIDDPTPGDRIVTITGIQDNGGTANGGSDSSNPGISSTIAVTAINDAPTNQGANGTPLSRGIEIVDNGGANPYPAATSVSGLTGNIQQITVTLNGLTHNSATDVDILLMSPTGEMVLLLSDIGEQNDAQNLDPSRANNVTLTFDDNALQDLTSATEILSGTYRPSDISGRDDTFPGSGTVAPYSTTLATFNGLNPNGTWQLFVRDDAGGTSGVIAGGWDLTITTTTGSGTFNSAVAGLVTREDTPISFTGSNQLSIADVDSHSGNLEVTLTVSNGTLTLANANLTGSGNNSNSLTYSGSLANLNAALATLVYTPNTDFYGTDSLTITTNDQGNTGNGGPLSDTDRIAITVTPVNDAPTLTATLVNPSFTEAPGIGTQQAAVNPFVDAVVGQLEEAQLITNMSFTIAGIRDAAKELLVVDGVTIALDANSTGTTTTNGLTYNVTIVTGTATVTLAKATGISGTAVNTLINTISYQNIDLDNPTPGDRTFTVTQLKDNGGTADGGADTRNPAASSIVKVIAINDAPTLTSTVLNPTFTEAIGTNLQANAVSLFSGTATSAIEVTQAIKTLTITVAGLQDGTNEILTIDGTPIALVAGSGTTATNSTAYSVTVNGTTATIALTKTGDIPPATITQIVNGLTYQNTNRDNPTAGDRIITLASVQDNGGTNPGVDTTTLNLSTTVTVIPVNDAPTLALAAQNLPFTEKTGINQQAAPVLVFKDAAIGQVETSQSIVGLTLTVSNLQDGDDEVIIIDGTEITLGLNTSSSTVNGINYDLSILGTTATIVLTSSGLTTAETATLLNGITYQNTNRDNPTAGNRTFNLTQLIDSGSNLTPNVNTTNFSTLTANVAVVPVNDAPTLTVINTSRTTNEGILVTNSGTFNDLEGQTVTLSASIGSVSKSGNNWLWSYTPPDSFATTTVTITANDGNGGSSTTGFSLTVNNVNPTATLGNGGAVNEGNTGSVTFTGSTDFSSVDSTSLRYAYDFDNDGTWEIGGDGSYANASTSTTPVVPASYFADGAASGTTRTVKGRILDKDGGFTDYTTTIAINNVAPAGSLSGSLAAGIEDTAYTISTSTLLAGFTDVPGDTIGLSGLTLTTPSNGGLVNNNDGSFTFTPSLNFNGPVGLSYNVVDEDGGSRAVTRTIVLDPRDDIPTLITSTNAIASTFTEALGQGIQAAAVPVFTTAVVDPIEPSQLITSMTLTISGLVDGAKERIVIDGRTILLGNSGAGTTTTNAMGYSVAIAAGTATITLSKASGLSPTIIDSVITGITYQNTDKDKPTPGDRIFTITQMVDTGTTGNGNFNTAALTNSAIVKVVGTNDVPTLEVDSVLGSTSISGNEASTITQTGTFNDFDGNATTTLSASIGTLTQNNTAGTWSWSYQPTDSSTTQQVTITAIDDQLASTTATFDLTVNNVNPTATIGNGGAVNEGSTGTVSLTGATDASSVDATSLRYAYDFDGNGTWDGATTYATATSTDSITVPATALADGPGTHTIRGRIFDKDGGFTEYTTTITINNVAPALTGSQATLANGTEDTTYDITTAQLLQGFTDVTADTISLVGTPTLSASQGTIAAISGGYRITPALNYNGLVTLSYQVKDEDGGVTNASITFSLAGVNDAPVNTIGTAVETLEDTAIAFTGTNQISISDVDAGTSDLSVTLSVSNGSLTLGNTTGLTAETGNTSSSLTYSGSLANLNAALATLSYQGNLNFNGTDTLTITTNDQGNSGSGGAKSDIDTVTINVTPVNDKPTLTTTPIANNQFTEATGLGIQAPAVTVFSTATTGLGGNSSNPGSEATQAITSLTFTVAGLQDGANETITVNGQTIALGATSTTTVNGITYSSTIASGTATIVLTNSTGFTPTQVDSLITGLTYQNTNLDNPTAGARTFTITELKDNGGITNNGLDTAILTNSATINVVATNDTPVNTVGTTVTVLEDTAVSITGLSISDIDAGSGDLSVTLSVTNGTLTLGNITGLTAATGNTTTSLTYSGSLANLNAALATLTYQGNLNFNGSDTLTITTNDQGNSGSGGAKSDTDTVTINVTPVNDEPTLSATGSDLDFVEGIASPQAPAVAVFTNAIANPIAPVTDTTESSQTFTDLTFTIAGLQDGANEKLVVDGLTIGLGSNSSGTTTTNALGYDIAIVNGTATVTLSNAAGISSTVLNGLVNGIAYQNTNTVNPTAGDRTFTLTQLKDNGGVLNSGDDTVALNIQSAITVVPINDAPTITATSLTPTFTEAAGVDAQADAVSLFSGAATSTIEPNQTIKSLTLEVTGLKDGDSEILSINGQTIALGTAGSTTVGTTTYSSMINGTKTTVTITDTTGFTPETIDSIIDDITYQNTNKDNPTAGDRTITLTQVQDDGGTLNGGVDSTSPAIAATVTVTPVNDAPTLTATALNPTFTEASGQPQQAAAVALFSTATAGLIETDQTITELTFTVSGLIDGADEKLVVDGTTIALTATTGTPTTTTNGITYSVTIGSGTATVSLTKPAGISAAALTTLVNGLAYQNTNTTEPTAGARTLTLTQLKDSGGTALGGADTTTLALSSTVTVVAINDAPTLTATALNPTFTEATGANTQTAAVSLFSGATTSTIESNQTIKTLVLTLSGLKDGANETLQINGQTITLGADSTQTAAGLFYSTTIDAVTQIATITLASSAGITPIGLDTIINSIQYQNTNTDAPTAGNRTITVTTLQDSGGTANDGQDIQFLNLSSTVTVVATNDVPVMTLTNIVSNITENVKGAVIADVSTTDIENDAITYSVKANGVLDDRFEVVAGQLKLKSTASLDYEAAASLNLEVIATDNGSPSQSASSNFTLAINDVNERPIIQNLPPVTTIIPATSGQTIAPIRFLVTDPNQPNTSLLRVSVRSQNQTLIPLRNIRISGSGAERFISFTPAALRSGTTQLTVVVTAPNGETTEQLITVQVTPSRRNGFIQRLLAIRTGR